MSDAFDSKPLAPDFEFVLNGNELDFQTGLSALSRIAPTFLGISSKQTMAALTEAKNVDVYVFKGAHPAGNVGVQINHIKPVNKGEIVWTVDPEVVIFIGRLFNSGKVNMTRVIALGGSRMNEPAYCKAVIGADLATLLNGRIADAASSRIINGNVLTGVKSSMDGWLQSPYRHITAIPEVSKADEFMGWASLNPNRFSIYRTFTTWLAGKRNKECSMDARLKGGERAIVCLDEYDRMLPMDIYAEFLLKAIIAFDIDKMEQLGIYEVAPEDFALAEYADTSKIELQRIVREGLDRMRAEMS